LINEFDKANELLECAEDQEGDVYYLRAIVAARIDNKDKVLSNLEKAISKNNKWKTEAKNDVEFLKYRMDADFHMILN
jgi:hypothetical protein